MSKKLSQEKRKLYDEIHAELAQKFHTTPLVIADIRSHAVAQKLQHDEMAAFYKQKLDNSKKLVDFYKEHIYRHRKMIELKPEEAARHEKKIKNLISDWKNAPLHAGKWLVLYSFVAKISPEDFEYLKTYRV